MSYKTWHEEHGKKHAKIVSKLSHLNDDEIIEYFKFENMVKHEPDFCILYQKNEKCHNMQDLNCYLCACPHFRVATNKSFCSIDSKDGGSIEHNQFIHQDCSKCIIPHKKGYIKKNFSRNWREIMSRTFV